MTDTAPVTQADRELGAAICELLGLGPCQHILDGLEDDVGVVPMVARHRLAAEQSRATPAVDREALVRFRDRLYSAWANQAQDVKVNGPEHPGLLEPMEGILRQRLEEFDAILALQPPVMGEVEAEPFGYWIEQKGAEPVLLRKPAYIPEPSELRTVTPVYLAPPSMGNVAAALRKQAEGWRNVIEFGLLPKQHHGSARILAEEADAALATLSTEQVR